MSEKYRIMKTRSNSSPWTIRPSAERGYANHGWLETYHSFSFANYYDTAHMGFRSLRVINEDRIAAGTGFPTHPHREMEIFSYLLSGALSHKDSMGNAHTLKPGEIQVMSAGTGVTHSEFNPSRTESTHMLQIWLQPRERGLAPRYTEWVSSVDGDTPKELVISSDGREHSATIAQDASIYRLRLTAGQSVTHDLAETRGAWIQVVRGSVESEGISLAAGDGASTETPGRLTFKAGHEGAEALLFDLG